VLQSIKELSGAFSFTVFSCEAVVSILGILRRANLENLNLLTELLKVNARSSAADVNV
jgi:hypothetical protein